MWHAQAQEAYSKALEIEPDDQALQEAEHRADVAERKAAAEHKHKFKQQHDAVDSGKAAPAKKAKAAGPMAAAGVKQKSLLSFQDDE